MVALARDLETSPLYAFHYMMKGVRRGEDNTLSGRKAELYIDLVERYIDQGQGDLKMSHARKLTLLYRQFYRHKRTEGKRPSNNSILRPIDEAAKALLGADKRLFNDEESLCEMVKARLEQFLLRVQENKADGKIPNWIPSTEREKALNEFSHYIVETIYRDVFGKDVSAFAGKQLNLLRDTCASIYMAENWRAWREHGEKSDDDAHDETGNGTNGESDNHSEENTSK
jgi:CRISPR-associated protein Csc3